MKATDILRIVKENSLTIRCLPETVISINLYREGDENITPYQKSIGVFKKEIEIQNFDLEYFKNTPPPMFSNMTPKQRFESFKRSYPNGRKILKSYRKVKNGGWWYVKETKNTSSTIRFNRKTDKFFDTTLEGAIKMYLKSKN